MVFEDHSVQDSFVLDIVSAFSLFWHAKLDHVVIEDLIVAEHANDGLLNASDVFKVGHRVFSFKISIEVSFDFIAEGVDVVGQRLQLGVVDAVVFVSGHGGPSDLFAEAGHVAVRIELQCDEWHYFCPFDRVESWCA